jgi:2-amino-4-hydroxy-6-hydroxymethyldihydropteridine diphosphokinase
VKTRAYISVGSNVEPVRHIQGALRALAKRYGPVQVSRTYQTPAAGFAGEDFLNLVLGIETDEPIATVMAFLREIESAEGRVRGGPRFAPRTLDLDLLTYGNTVSSAPDPVLPRADILEYNFVLGPLAELAGSERHPVAGQTYAELWAAMQTSTGPLREFPLNLDGAACSAPGGHDA